mgnify:CR=1 FL=1
MLEAGPYLTYRDVRADDCDLDSLGDMLFCEWGSYDWGAGEQFEFTVFRQFFCRPSGPADERDLSEDADNHIWHLDLKLRFTPTPELRALGQGGQACSSLAELDEFRAAVRASPAFGLVQGRSGGEVAVLYECAG